MQLILALVRYLLYIVSALLEAPWRFLENQAVLLDPDAGRHSAALEPAEADDEPVITEVQSDFLSTAALLAERERLREELRRAESAEEEVL
eukprot:875274-Prymnesium_polylepis.1